MGIMRGVYKPKVKNITKLIIYLNNQVKDDVKVQKIKKNK